MDKIKVGITQGDTNGVGYEVILKAFEDPTMLELCTPVIYGSPKIATFHRKALGLNVSFTTVSSASQVQDGRVNLVDVVPEEVKIDLGHESAEAGKAALLSLEAAVADCKQGLVDVLVTAPINKHSIQSEFFHFPGHTEYLESCLGEGHKAMMVLMYEGLRVVLLTTHLPLSDVAGSVTEEAILEKLQAIHAMLGRDFGISMPRTAVLSLNPHAGDQGLLGREEQEVIIPAIKKAEEQGMLVWGPYPSDGFFGNGSYRHFDAILAMYHDQGLAPFKTLAMDGGVNYTAGLPVVRTSPDHGTAYDIAGKNQASPNSFIQAVYAAIDIYRHRMEYDASRANPLPKLYVDKREDGRGRNIE